MKDNKDDKIYNKVREIEFRGKNIKTKEWHYGSLVSKYDVDACLYCQYHILEKSEYSRSCDWDSDLVNANFYEVDENTIGQFTGLCDKNGKKIYEGDVVKFIDYDSYDEGFENAGVVKYGGNMFYVTNRYSVNMEDLVDDLEGSMYCEVISNIYDDTEMWEEYDEKPNN